MRNSLTAATVPKPRSPDGHGATRWLDGVRFAAAMFVVVHHCWLAVYPDFPRNTGPAYLGWMLYGHLAVVVFIVVSGYSLTLAPARNGLVLTGGARTFAKRRAWRILPPYWAALVLSIFVFALVQEPDSSVGTVTKSFVVHGLLLQDVIGSETPNGAFWSIAVEAQIYILFPALLLLARKGVVKMAALVLLVTAGLELLAHQAQPLARYDNLSPQLLIDFTFGVVAASSTSAIRIRRWRIPLIGAAGVMLGAGALAIAKIGSVDVVRQYFWVDVVAGFITAVAFRGIANARKSRIRDAFQSRLMVFGGRFSYSIYLIHALVVTIVVKFIVARTGLSGLPKLALLMVIVIPSALAVSYGFFRIFEEPFLRIRSVDALPAALRRPISRWIGHGQRETADLEHSAAVIGTIPDRHANP